MSIPAAQRVPLRWLVPAVLLAWLGLVLLAGAPSKLIGDGGEYFTTAAAMAQGAVPPFSPQELARGQAVLAARESRFRTWDVRALTWETPSGDRDFIHFWGYSLLAAPGAWIAMRVEIDPAWSFVVFNVLLLTLATAIVVRRFGVAAALLVCASPILWWADKVHTEAFTFSLLSVAIGLLSAAPHWSMVAIGLAATQNPPLALLLAPFAAAAWHAGAIRSRRVFAGGLAAGLVIAAAHPAYYLLTFGRVSLLTSASRGVMPSVQELGAVIWDTNLGLVPGDPIFAVAVVVSIGAVLLSGRLAWREPEWLASIASVIIILAAAAQTPNIHHGGTPGVSRYGLWLLPFAAPLVSQADRGRGRAYGLLAALSALACLVAYWPSVPEGAYRPSTLSRVLWTRVPWLVDPLPEVFSETISRVDGPITVPAALSGCEKALLLGGISRRGLWPIPCYPSGSVPVECRSAGALCYANRENQGYEYVTVPRPRGMDIQYDSSGAWSPDAEAAVRRLYDEVGWWTIQPGDALEAQRAVRQVTGVDKFWHFQSDRAVLLVARGIAPRAFVSVRPPRPMSGMMVDGVTGATVGEFSFPEGPATRVDLALPAGHDVLLVVLR